MKTKSLKRTLVIRELTDLAPADYRKAWAAQEKRRVKWIKEAGFLSAKARLPRHPVKPNQSVNQ